MKVLIIPDIHNRCELAEKIIKLEGADEVIFLGDYFDDFGDDPATIAETATWFCNSVHTKNRIHLCGNHDIHYWFNQNKMVRCSGYDQFKDIAINDIVTQEEWKQLKFFHVLDNQWLLSHGGVHPTWIDPKASQEGRPVETTLKKVVNKLTRDTESFMKALGRNEWHWFLMPGFSRSGGRSPYYGGLLWCDFNQEFHPIRGVHQIVGHTPMREPLWVFLKEDDAVVHSAGLGVVPKLSDKTSYNVCIDTSTQHYIVYEDGKLSIESVSALKGP